MLPIILSPKFLKPLVIGKGPATSRRLEMLKAANVNNIKYVENFPKKKDFKNINIVYVADFDDEISSKIYKMAEKKNLLINIEDKIDFCIFHAPAIIRRGDLLITSSTAGKGPRLARRIKRILENMFDENWGDNLEKLSSARNEYKKLGYKFDSMAEKIDAEIDKHQMFKNFCDRCMK